MTQPPITMVGAGIGGLACALLLARAGRDVQVLERATAPAPVGAGIQLGPNATRLLQAWGLGEAIRSVAVEPVGVRVRDARSGSDIAERSLAAVDAPWLCVHRAALHDVLLTAATRAGARIQWGTPIDALRPTLGALIAADGAFSAVRALAGDASMPQPTGHWAWRCLLPLASLPAEFQDAVVQPWWGAAHHVVTYPVRLEGQTLLNVVAFTRMLSNELNVQGTVLRSWAEPADAPSLLKALGPIYAGLAHAIGKAPSVTRWPVVARLPLDGPGEMICRFTAYAAVRSGAPWAIPLVGDAAHPMRPYMAQGAAMALEDAAVLCEALAAQPDWRTAVEAYAHARWQRNAMLQRRSERNGRIFHLPPPLSWARNAALKLRPALMDSAQVHSWRLESLS